MSAWSSVGGSGITPGPPRIDQGGSSGDTFGNRWKQLWLGVLSMVLLIIQGTALSLILRLSRHAACLICTPPSHPSTSVQEVGACRRMWQLHGYGSRRT